MTTNVQLVSVYDNMNCTSTVSCEFVAGSMADGCLVTLAENVTNMTITKHIIIQREHNVTVAALNVPSTELFQFMKQAYHIRAVGVIDGNRTDVIYVQTQFTPNLEQPACLSSGTYM